VLVGPKGKTVDRSPEYTWAAVPGAESYDLTVPNERGEPTTLNVSAAEGIVCQGVECRFTPPFNAPVGEYTWQVTAVMPDGYRVDSAPLAFSVVRLGYTAGVFRPSLGTFFLTYSNQPPSPNAPLRTNAQFIFGRGDDLPFAIDPDGDGLHTIGVFRSQNGFFFIAATPAPNTPIATQFPFPLRDRQNDDIYMPVVGDWDGDGKDGVGVMRVRNGRVTFFLKNALDASPVDYTLSSDFNFGPQAIGVAGDWDGDGIDTVGVFQPAARLFTLEDRPCMEANCTLSRRITATVNVPEERLRTERPITGAWGTTNKTGIGIYRAGVFYLLPIQEGQAPRSGKPSITSRFGLDRDLPIMGVWRADVK
jgi:hypothetical protein